MRATPIPFTILMERVVAGSEAAARQLYERFSPYVRNAVREELPSRLRSKYDSDDLTQIIWGDFFTRVIKVCHPQSPEELLGLLRRLAHCRTVDVIRQFFGTEARNLGREYSFERNPMMHRLTLGMASGEIGPGEIAAFNELWEELIAQQKNRLTQRIMLMLRDGRSYAEIASRCNVSVSTVRRTIRRIAQARPKPNSAPDEPPQ